MTVEELRAAFLEFFEERGHRRIPSSPLVPYGDPSLLFTSAGMVQFKPYFLGLAEPPASRMTSIQKCFRTTDIEEVGDGSHLTFFEMLGNFSIGDYFKAEAIAWSWEFFTGALGLPAERLYATVFTDDDEAHALWIAQGVPPERILRYTAEQGNYWYSGDTGPCGPCSELHYDFGLTEGCPECAAGRCHPAIECGRFLEVWNLVFMAFDRQEGGALLPLPTRNIDTGAGLERVASVLQGVRSVYETDQLRSIVARVESISGTRYDPAGDAAKVRALRSIAEHSRAVTFLVSDGVLPGNEGRGYVLRRVLRRAVYFGYTIGLTQPFFGRCVDAAIEASAGAYPVLREQQDYIRRVAETEESRFQAVLARGLAMLEDVLAREARARRLPGRDMFVLYDTHGLPPELTAEVAASRGFSVDHAGFEAEMAAQRERSRGETAFDDFGDPRAERYRELGLSSEFVGYETTQTHSTVQSLVTNAQVVQQLDAGQRGELVLVATSFYPEGGGQVGDRGEIVTPGGRFTVEDTQRWSHAIVHIGTVAEGTLRLGDEAEAAVDVRWRSGSERNHTGTHLLHAALRQVLGTHVRQAGSLVTPDRLRFDYTSPDAPRPEQLREAQRIVNAKVRADIARETLELPYEEAISRGAIAFFEDRYSADVRMVEYCEQRAQTHVDHVHTTACFSRELCGGTHLHSTGGVGMLVIVSDASIGAGIRRIEALTGPEAEQYLEQRLDLVQSLSQRYRVPPEELPARLDALEEQLAEERRRSAQQLRQGAAQQADELAARAEESSGLRVVVARIDADSADALRAVGDRLRERLGGGAVAVLAAVANDRPLFLALCGEDAVARGLRADDLLREPAKLAGGGGGGRPQLAQAGGKDASQVDAALALAKRQISERLAP